LRLCFGKTIWNRVFLSETSEKLRFNYLRIMSICRYETVTIQKSWFMNVFIQIFIKKDLDIKFKLVLFWELPVLYHIDDTEISYCLISYLLSFLYRFCNLSHAWSTQARIY
jgi:hypothetical protein